MTLPLWLNRSAAATALSLGALAVIVSIVSVVGSRAGYQAHLMPSESMAPRLEVGDLVISRQVSSASIRAGDMISFQEPNTNVIVTHRVVAIRNGAGGVAFITRGDANANDDPWGPIHYTGSGRVTIASIPAVGRVLFFLQTLSGRLTAVFAILLLIVTIILPTAPSHSDKKPRSRSALA